MRFISAPSNLSTNLNDAIQHPFSLRHILALKLLEQIYKICYTARQARPIDFLQLSARGFYISMLSILTLGYLTDFLRSHNKKNAHLIGLAPEHLIGSFEVASLINTLFCTLVFLTGKSDSFEKSVSDGTLYAGFILGAVGGLMRLSYAFLQINHPYFFTKPILPSFRHSIAFLKKVYSDGSISNLHQSTQNQTSLMIEKRNKQLGAIESQPSRLHQFGHTFLQAMRTAANFSIICFILAYLITSWRDNKTALSTFFALGFALGTFTGINDEHFHNPRITTIQYTLEGLNSFLFNFILLGSLFEGQLTFVENRWLSDPTQAYNPNVGAAIAAFLLSLPVAFIAALNYYYSDQMAKQHKNAFSIPEHVRNRSTTMQSIHRLHSKETDETPIDENASKPHALTKRESSDATDVEASKTIAP